MKSSRVKGIGIVLLALLSVSAAVLAQDIPLNNWTVGPYHRQSTSGGLQTMTDITSGTGFVGIQPCRVVDTRGGGVFVGAYGPPIMAANATRDFDINSAPHCPGIPAAAEAYSLNFTVTQTAGASGDIRAWPTGTPPTVVTSVLNWQALNTTIANATIIPAGTAGSITVQVAGSNTHLLIDINGYFTESYNDGVAFEAIGNVGAFFFPGFLVLGANSNTGIAAYGVWGLTSSPAVTNPGAASAGVGGWSSASVGVNSGVFGQTASTHVAAAGVLGLAQDGADNDDRDAGHRHGGPGVLAYTALGQAIVGINSGNGAGEAVTGIVSNGLGVSQSQGYLGYTGSTAVRAEGNITKSGTVTFTEPHPTDASKKIVYVALEGNEVGTYFRGRGRFQNGMATIAVPENFRMVTEPDGLSIQVTPIGEMATVAVAEIGLDRIVVRASRNVEFFYTVNGIRRGYADFQAIAQADKDYVPESPDERMPTTFSAEIRSRLIANGTYKPDGSVNMETAQRLGWDRVWQQRASFRPEPQQFHSP